jgi:predicted hydrocarbon binding protein
LKNLAENNLIRFVNLTRKKDAIHANFKVKGMRNGVVFSASIAVDITALELHPGDTLEKIIEECARHGVKEFKKAEIQFEGLASVLSDHLGVAQLG